jgi:hypothetical protein
MVNGLLNFELYLRPCGAQNYCRLPIADCRLPIADCRLPIAPAFAKATAGKDCRLIRRPRVAEALAEAQALLPSLKLWQPKSVGELPIAVSRLMIIKMQVCKKAGI